MKTLKRITGKREQSKGNVPRESIWYFNEETVLDSTPVKSKESGKFDNRKAMNEKNNRLAYTIERNKPKKESSFVVDWQLSESI